MEKYHAEKMAERLRMEMAELAKAVDRFTGRPCRQNPASYGDGEL